MQTEEDPGGDAPNLCKNNLEIDTEEFNSLRTESNEESGTDTGEDSQGEPESRRSGQMGMKSLYFDEIAARRGVNSRGYKDPGVMHPPRNRVKTDPEGAMLHDMYSGAGYSTKRGVINIQVNRAAPPPPAMTEEECESHVVGIVLAQMYNLRKGIEFFGESADEAVHTELTQVDEFETYQPMHKHELSEEDHKKALESTMKVTEK